MPSVAGRVHAVESVNPKIGDDLSIGGTQNKDAAVVRDSQTRLSRSGFRYLRGSVLRGVCIILRILA